MTRTNTTTPAPGYAGHSGAHTAGKCHVVEHVGGAPRYWLVTNPDTWVSRVAAVPDYDGIGAANAARLALAWNCHDELVATLRLVEEHYGEDSDVFCLVRAALAKAEGRS